MTEGHDQGPDRAEPFWWGLFAAGGGLTALFAPAHILFQHLLGPIGFPAATSSYERARGLAANPLVRLYLLALTSLSFFHWAHRFRYYVMDFGVLGARRLIAVTCYGSAIFGTLGAARTLWRLPRKDA
ncbi:MAG TPA: fumarate reductase subunit D [Chloroflexota bacterium]|jgi:fumarate reductase subunit D